MKWKLISLFCLFLHYHWLQFLSIFTQPLGDCTFNTVLDYSRRDSRKKLPDCISDSILDGFVTSFYVVVFVSELKPVPAALRFFKIWVYISICTQMQELQKNGIKVAVRSQHEKLLPGTNIYIVDTLGLPYFPRLIFTYIYLSKYLKPVKLWILNFMLPLHTTRMFGEEQKKRQKKQK